MGLGALAEAFFQLLRSVIRQLEWRTQDFLNGGGGGAEICSYSSQ